MFDRLRHQARALIGGSRMDRELEREVRFHIEMETEKHVRLGVPPDEARRHAMRTFGGVERFKEECRDARGVSRLEQWLQDVRYAARTLRKNPAFTAVAVLTLSLGIGANTVIFSVVDAAFFARYPLEAPDRLLRVYAEDRTRQTLQLGFSAPKFELFRAQQSSFTALAAANYNAFTLITGTEPVQLNGASVTSDFLDTFGARPIAGRFFRADEEVGGRAVVLGESLWRSRFESDPGVLGRSLTLSGQPYTVIGVAPALPAFWDAQVWLPDPLLVPGIPRELLQRGVTFLAVVGRLKADTSALAASSEVELLARRYREAFPGNADAAWSASAIGLRDDIVGTSRSALLTLLAAVGVLLLVACANVANLLLVRFTGRRQEVGLRTALGASRIRIVRQFLVESSMISIASAAVGAVMASWTLPALLVLADNNLPFAADIHLSVPVLIGTIGVALVAGLATGAYPALQGSRADIVVTLRDGGRTIAGAIGSHRARRAIVAGQVALSLLLVIGAALLVLSFVRLRGQPTGFDAGSVFIAALNLPSASYPDPEIQSRFYLRLADALASTPGVMRASLAQSVPLSGAFTRAPYAVNEGDVRPLAERPLGLTQSITPGYFQTLGIPLLAGRDFTERDSADAPLTVIVSQSTARKLFPDGNVLGRQLVMGSSGGGQAMEIVGVVGDVRSQTLAAVDEVEFYRTVMQRPRTFMQMVVRTTGEAAAFESTARKLLRSIDPALPLTGVNTLDALVDASLAQQRLLFTLLVTFAVMAVVLSAVGIYGVVAAYVAQRTSEFGVRIALGARGVEVVRLVLAQTLRPVFLGLAIGLIGAIAGARVMQTLLFEVSVLNPWMLLVSAGGLAVVACAACAAPALRAARIDPVRALRNE